MKIRPKISGFDGNTPYEAGEELTIDNLHTRKLLVNGLADPLDDQATAFLANTSEHEEYLSSAYQAMAAQLNQGD